MLGISKTIPRSLTCIGYVYWEVGWVRSQSLAQLGGEISHRRVGSGSMEMSE